MKRRDLERKLKQLGWWFSKHGGEHDRPMVKSKSLFQDTLKSKEFLAKKILKKAEENPPQKEE
jgi:predicted RNA binding protein YcfA (HicA-like mRNA interferase family)